MHTIRVRTNNQYYPLSGKIISVDNKGKLITTNVHILKTSMTSNRGIFIKKHKL